MKLLELHITDEIGCQFHDGLNIIFAVNRGESTSDAKPVEPPPRNEGESDVKGENVAADSTSEDLNKEAALQGDSKVSDTNGVGKTLLVSVIKHILGGDTEKALSSSFFTNRKLWGTLTVDVAGGPLTISRPLWRPLAEDLYLVMEAPGDAFRDTLVKAKVELTDIASELELAELLKTAKVPVKLQSKQEFQKYLAKLENIDYSVSNITFSALLDFIIRDEKVGFTDPISRIRRAQWVQYRSAQYLFGLPAATEETCAKLQEDISNLKVNLKSITAKLDARGVTGEDKLVNLRIAAESRLSKARQDIEAVRVVPSLEDARAAYEEERKNFTAAVSALSKKQRYLIGYTKNREDLKSKTKAMSELLKVGEFYEDLVQFFPKQLEENIADFHAFFDGLAGDRDRYYTDLIVEIKADIKYLQSERDRLEPQLSELAKQFKSSSLLKDIATLAASEERIQSELRELEECGRFLIERENTEDQLEELERRRKEALAEGKKEERKFKSRREALIGLFHELIGEIYGADNGELAFEYNSTDSSSTAGRTEIVCRIPSQSSHGRTYAKINIFDFVWFLGHKGEDNFRSGFLIHDGSYSKISRDVKAKMLAAVSKRLTGQQYLITINEGELDMTPEYDAAVCCRLDGSKIEGKFFHEQFD